MFWVYDNLLRDSVAEDVHDRVRNLSWEYNKHSIRKSNKKIYGDTIYPHFGIRIAGSEDDLITYNYEYLLPLLEAAKNKFHVPVKLKRVYMNAHTFGVEPYIHTDDGDYTFIYYPRLDWKPHWLGGTALWDKEEKNIHKYCNYIGNRLLVFHADTKHQAMPVSRMCHELRSVIVFKTIRDEELLLQRLKDSL